MATQKQTPTSTIVVEATEVLTPESKSVVNKKLLDKDGNVNLANLTESQKAKCLEVTKNLNPETIGCVSNYGVNLTGKLMESGGNLLNSRSTSDKETDELIKSIMKELNRIDLDDLNEPSAVRRFIEKIPILNKLLTTVEDKITEYKTVQEKVQSMKEKIGGATTRAYAENQELQLLYNEIVEYIGRLETLIVAGQYRAEVEQEKTAHMQAEGAEQMAIVRQNAFVNQLEKRIDNLRSVYVVSKTQLYEIFLTQQTNIAVADAARDLQQITMGAFSTQLKVLAAIAHQRDSIKTLQLVREGANKAIKSTAETLAANVKDMTTFANQPTFDMDTISSAIQSVRNAITEATQIEQKAKQERIDRMQQYAKLDQELKQISALQTNGQIQSDTSVGDINLFDEETE